MTEQTETTAPTIPIHAHRDGHTLSILVDHDSLRGRINCPHAGRDFADVPVDDRPACRKAFNPETGEAEAAESQPKRCMAADWYDDLGAESFNGPEFEVRQAPVPIAYWWGGHDSDEFWVALYSEAASSWWVI